MFAGIVEGSRWRRNALFVSQKTFQPVGKG